MGEEPRIGWGEEKEGRENPFLPDGEVSRAAEFSILAWRQGRGWCWPTRHTTQHIMCSAS